MILGQNKFQGYERFRIPPDFDLVELHKQTNYIYLDSSKAIEMCPCCEKLKRQKQIPLSVGSATLSQLGQQIPMLFFYLKATSLFLFCMAIAKFGDYYLCNLIEGEDNCSIIYAQFDIPEVDSFRIPSGFKQKNDTLTFVQFIIFVIGIILLKIAIKIKKYQIKQITKDSISNRALKLINVHKQCTQSEIKETFKPLRVQVVLTYRVREFDQCLTKINKLLKMKKLKQQRKGSFINETEKEIDEKMRTEKQTLQNIKKQLKMDRNRMSIAFVIFETSQQRKQVYQKFKKTLFSRLFYKACSCCSDTAIRGQSFTVKPADQPADIIWPNLQNPYLRTKIRRFLSIFVCFTLLVFGVATEYLLTGLSMENSLVGPLIKSIIVMILNFLIVTLMDYSTQHMENYESHTERHLTLVKKMTAFLFINISVPPLVGYYFTLENSDKNQTIKETLFYNFCFSVLVLALGNISKPFPLWFSVERVTKTLGKWMGRRNGEKCILTQIQANKQFQPIQFPISTFYSMSLSSFLMVCFYVNILQSIILIEMVSLVLMYLVGKYMLLRVCKSPAGLARRISNLAQSLLRVVIFVNWLGKVSLTYLNLNEEQKTQHESFFGYIFRNAFGYLEFILAVGCLLFLEFFVAWISKLILQKFGKSLKSSIHGASHTMLLNQDDDEFEMTYANANMNMKLYEEYVKYSKTEQAIKKKQEQKKKKVFR